MPILPMPVLVVEDEPLMQQRLLTVLEGLGYERDAIHVSEGLEAARRLVRDQPISMALIDLGLPDGNGISLIEELRADDPALSLLVISAWSTEDVILSALRAGATGYVLKERDDQEIALSIRSVLRGGAPIDPFIARRLLALLPDGDGAGGAEGATGAENREGAKADTAAGVDAKGLSLSKRESEILHLVAEGLTNREIAEQLFISRYTAECHIKHIYRKLAVSSRTRAVNVARRHGLLS